MNQKRKTFNDCISYLKRNAELSRIYNTPNGVSTWYIKCNDDNAYRISNTKFENDITPEMVKDMMIYSIVFDENAQNLNTYLPRRNVIEFVYPISRDGEWENLMNRIIKDIKNKKNDPKKFL